jgi:Leucine-rich repeat (LRR) protein
MVGPTKPRGEEFAADPAQKPHKKTRRVDEKIASVIKKRERTPETAQTEGGKKFIALDAPTAADAVAKSVLVPKASFTTMSMQELLALGETDARYTNEVFDEIRLHHPSLLEGGPNIEKAKQNYATEKKRGEAALLAALQKQNPEFRSSNSLKEAIQRHDLIQKVTEISNLRELQAITCILTELPSEIGSCLKLEIFFAGGNRLTRLPDSIGHCRSLQILSLAENHLTTLPASLGGCVKLERLLCEHNTLKALPPWIGAFTSLVFLDIRDNCIKELPIEIGLCKKLRTLSAASNYIREIPHQIEGCSQLFRLDLLNNRLRELPSTIGSCRALSELCVSNNQLLSIPDTIKQCRDLAALLVSNNDLTSLPTWLSESTSLKILHASGNKIVKIHDTIPPSLEWLAISFKNLKPQELTILKSRIKTLQDDPMIR